ncbi:hypothetical protein KC19_9G160300 [Ceratodon purpureus]|uniref:BHLH domain-containing protein n=1 Tax=Ceratodon purpureus TaxID=3225 RepID=A0A8T0H0E6_CERPU|nr:hypothetical protein KC19_9G160300 [Ceratodon purpureus]
MAGPSRHGGHEEVRPTEADDQMQRSGLQGGASNDPQVATLPWLRRDPRSVSVNQDALPLRSLDPVSDSTGFTASVGDQLRTPLSTGLSPLTHASQQPANLPTNRGRMNGSPTRSRLNRRGTRLARQRRPVYAGGQEGCERQRPAELPHILSERNEKRREMNALFTLLQRVLPTSTASSRLDMRASVLTDAIEYIEALKLELATERQGNAPRVQPSAANEGLVCFDYTGNPNAVTAVATVPAPGSHPSTMASCIGNNVAVHANGRVFFVTVMTRVRDTGYELLGRVLMVLLSRRLDVDPRSASISVRESTVVYTFNCQVHPTVNVTSYDLHGELQKVVNQYNDRTN